jgi:hypothetical protein
MGRGNDRTCDATLDCRPREPYPSPSIARWSSLAARRAHNPEVAGSNPAPATTQKGLAKHREPLFVGAPPRPPSPPSNGSATTASAERFSARSNALRQPTAPSGNEARFQGAHGGRRRSGIPAGGVEANGLSGPGDLQPDRSSAPYLDRNRGRRSSVAVLGRSSVNATRKQVVRTVRAFVAIAPASRPSGSVQALTTVGCGAANPYGVLPTTRLPHERRREKEVRDGTA